MNQSFSASTIPPANQTKPAYWFIFRGFNLLVQDEETKAAIPQALSLAEMGVTAVRRQYLGHLAGVHCYSAEVEKETSPPTGMAFYNLRRLYGRLEEPLFWLAGRAVQIVDWDRTHQFCGRCGIPTETIAHERARQCPQCRLRVYPRLSPAIIVQVTRQVNGRLEILLARGPRHPPGWYSTIAGFVEPGETLESCVAREVLEETGIRVQAIRYFGSQPWPFPNSLMLGFTAKYASGKIDIEEEEIEDAQWFAADNMPKVPPPLSISRALIDDFLAKAGTVKTGA